MPKKMMRVLCRKEEINMAYEDLKECLNGIYIVSPIFEVSTQKGDVESIVNYWHLGIRNNILNATDDVRTLAYMAEDGKIDIKSFASKVIGLINNIQDTCGDCFTEYIEDMFYLNLNYTMSLGFDEKKFILDHIESYAVIRVEVEK